MIERPAEVIARLRQEHQARLGEVQAALSPEGIRPYDLARQFFPWVPNWNMFLAVSEVWAHLELLAARGRVRVAREADGALRYSAH